MMYRYILLLWIVCYASLVSAQDCRFSLRGQVNDEDNSEHLSYAVIELWPLSQTTLSDEHGNFEFRDLCAGSYTLHVSHVGCRDTVLSVDLKSDLRVRLELPHSLNALVDVEVLARHEEAPPAQAATVLDLKVLDGVRGTDLATQLSRAPGITVQRTGPGIGKPLLNGMQGYRLLLLNHGVRLEGQQWGSEHAPEIDPFSARRLTILKGASAVRYGSDAIGGVILVDADALPDTAALTAEVETGYATNGRLFTEAARLQGYFDELRYFSWRLQGSYRNGGDHSAPGYVLKNTGVREGNFSYELGYHRKRFGVQTYYSQFNSRIGILDGTHADDINELIDAVNRGVPENTDATFSREFAGAFQKIRHDLFKAEADVHTGPRSRIKVMYALQNNARAEYDAPDEEAESGYNLYSQNGALSWEHDYIRSWRGAYGIQAQTQENDGTGDLFIPNYDSRSAGLFAVERFVRAHYEIECGLRYDLKTINPVLFENGFPRIDDLDFENLGYNLGGVWRPSGGLKMTLNFGNGWRSPAVNELYGNGLHHGAAAIEKGSQQLNREVVHSLIYGAELERKKFNAAVSLYHYRFSNYIFYYPDSVGSTVRGTYPVYSYTQAPATISGADVSAAYAVTKFADIKTKMMWIRGNNQRGGEPLLYMPADRYELSCRLHHSSRASDIYFEPGLLFVAEQSRVPEGLDITAPPPSYMLVNLEAGLDLQAGRQRLIFSVTVNNLLNVEYKDYLDRFRYFAHAPGRNIGLRLRFPLTLYDK